MTSTRSPAGTVASSAPSSVVLPVPVPPLITNASRAATTARSTSAITGGMRAEPHQAVEVVRAAGQHAQREGGVLGKRRQHGVQPGAVGQHRVDVGQCVVQAPRRHRPTSRWASAPDRRLIAGKPHRRALHTAAAVEPHRVRPVDQDVGDPGQSPAAARAARRRAARRRRRGAGRRTRRRRRCRPIPTRTAVVEARRAPAPTGAAPGRPARCSASGQPATAAPTRRPRRAARPDADPRRGARGRRRSGRRSGGPPSGRQRRRAAGSPTQVGGLGRARSLAARATTTPSRQLRQRRRRRVRRDQRRSTSPRASTTTRSQRDAGRRPARRHRRRGQIEHHRPGRRAAADAPAARPRDRAPRRRRPAPRTGPTRGSPSASAGGSRWPPASVQPRPPGAGDRLDAEQRRRPRRRRVQVDEHATGRRPAAPARRRTTTHPRRRCRPARRSPDPCAERNPTPRPAVRRVRVTCGRRSACCGRPA